MQTKVVSPTRRALIIEDEILIAEELSERLAAFGFSAVAVDSAEEGIAIAIREHPDLVLMDIRLKGAKDGVQAVKEIYEQLDVPIVYLTAHSDRLTVDRVKETNYDGFILKPFRAQELQSTIEVAIERHAIRMRQRER